MDALESKLFAQLDSDFPAERSNALELLREHLKNAGRTFRDIVDDIQSAIPAQRYDELRVERDAWEAQARQHAEANAGLVRQYQVASAQLTAFKTVLSIRRYWRSVTVCIVAPVIALVAWGYYGGEPAADRAAADAAFHRIAVATAWMNAERDSDPVVRNAAGAPYWVIARRSEDTEHKDSDGRAVTVQCVHLFAEKAVADAGVYLKPKSYALWGWGWLTWPERASDCRTQTARSAAK
jgi:hypothetical protein